jgi:DNA (cytosine-5)-methyltransferase 1
MTLDFINKPIAIDGPPRFTVVSTFSGCGGSSLGYMWAGGKVLLAVEWDKHAVETYRANFPDTPVFHGDIAKLSVEEVLARTGLKVGELDVLDGSPPCQGFSTAGKRILEDERNQLFTEYVRLLRGLQPKVMVMENVSGMVKGKMKLVFVEILKALKETGYHVSARLLNAKYFGVPQSRERLIFIGVRQDLGIEPSHPKAQTRPKGIVCMPETRKDYHLLTDHQIKTAIAHKSRHLAKGNGFGFEVLLEGKPSVAIKKTLIAGNYLLFIDNNKYYFPTEQELALIGGFSLDYAFQGSYKDVWARIGNSVPPRFMQAIAEHIRDNILQKVTQL